MGLTKHFYVNDGVLSGIPGDMTANGIIVHSVFGARTVKPEINIF
jgi:hypothetical protein